MGEIDAMAGATGQRRDESGMSTVSAIHLSHHSNPRGWCSQDGNDTSYSTLQARTQHTHGRYADEGRCHEPPFPQRRPAGGVFVLSLILPPLGRERRLGGKAVDNIVEDGLQRKEGSCVDAHATVRRRRLAPLPQGRIQVRLLRVLPMMVVEMAAKARMSSCPCTGEAASSASTAARRDASLASQNQ